MPPPHPGVAAHIEPEERAGGRGEEAAQEPLGQEADAPLGRVEPGIIWEVPVGSRAGLGDAAPAHGRRHFPAAPRAGREPLLERNVPRHKRSGEGTRGRDRAKGPRHQGSHSPFGVERRDFRESV